MTSHFISTFIKQSLVLCGDIVEDMRKRRPYAAKAHRPELTRIGAADSGRTLVAYSLNLASNGDILVNWLGVSSVGIIRGFGSEMIE